MVSTKLVDEGEAFSHVWEHRLSQIQHAFVTSWQAAGIFGHLASLQFMTIQFEMYQVTSQVSKADQSIRTSVT